MGVKGFSSLWRSSTLTVNCAIVVTVLAKELMKDGLGTHITVNFVARLVAAVVSNPVDVVKMRMMNMKVDQGRRQLNRTQ